MDYENWPHFCTHCKTVGHYIDICKNLNKTKNIDEPEASKTPVKHPKLEYVQKKDGRKDQGNQQNPIHVEDEVVDHSKTQFMSKRNEIVVAQSIVGTSGIKNTKIVVHKNRFKDLLINDEDQIRETML